MILRIFCPKSPPGFIVGFEERCFASSRGDGAGCKTDRPTCAGVVAALKREDRFALDAKGHAYLQAAPQSLWPILDGLVAARQDAAPRDENLIAAYQWLLANQLELIRYRTERGWTWADKMLDEYQDRISEIARSGRLAHDDLFSLAAP